MMRTFVALMTLLSVMFTAAAQDVSRSAQIGDLYWGLEDVKIPKPERWTELWAVPEHAEVVENNGLKPADLKKAVDAVKQYYKDEMIKAWKEYFDED